MHMLRRELLIGAPSFNPRDPEDYEYMDDPLWDIMDDDDNYSGEYDDTPYVDYEDYEDDDYNLA